MISLFDDIIDHQKIGKEHDDLSNILREKEVIVKIDDINIISLISLKMSLVKLTFIGKVYLPLI